MHDEAASLIALFACKVRDQYDVLESSPESGRVVLARPPARIILLFAEDTLLASLTDAEHLGLELWGENLTGREAAARLMTVHLDESLATRQAVPSGTWTYTGGAFKPGGSQ